jgi:hypothetical protein
MGFRLLYDAENRILLLSASGVVTDEVVLGGYELIKSCWERFGACSYVVDYTEAKDILLSDQAVRKLAKKKPILPPHCFQVNIAPHGVMHTLARRFQIASVQSRPTFQVVRTMKEALKLIGIASARFTPIDHELPKAA